MFATSGHQSPERLCSQPKATQLAHQRAKRTSLPPRPGRLLLERLQPPQRGSMLVSPGPPLSKPTGSVTRWCCPTPSGWLATQPAGQEGQKHPLPHTCCFCRRDSSNCAFILQRCRADPGQRVSSGQGWAWGCHSCLLAQPALGAEEQPPHPLPADLRPHSPLQPTQTSSEE